MTTSATYPPNHRPGMKVPRGGSMCANCKYLGDDSASCTEPNFVEWNGSARLPAPADEYCSDWYEPGQVKRFSESRQMAAAKALQKGA